MRRAWMLAATLSGCALAAPGTTQHDVVDAHGETDGREWVDADAAPIQSCGTPIAGVLVTYDFAGETGNQLATMPTFAAAE